MTPQLRSMKQQEAIDRNTAYRTLTPEEKIASLDERWGVGVGAARERARIARQLEEE